MGAVRCDVTCPHLDPPPHAWEEASHMTIPHEAIRGLASLDWPGYGGLMTFRHANRNRANNRNNNCGESVRARRNGDQA